MTVTTSVPMSLEEYLAYDDGTDRRYEIRDGVLLPVELESSLEVQVAGFLFAEFIRLGVPHYLLSCKTEIVLSTEPATTCYPDLMIKTEALDGAMPRDDRSIVMPEMPAPQLVVEIVSPGEPGDENYDRDYVEKQREYAQRGIPAYWILDPTHGVVLILALQGSAYREVGAFRGEETLISPNFEALALTAERHCSAKG